MPLSVEIVTDSSDITDKKNIIMTDVNRFFHC